MKRHDFDPNETLSNLGNETLPYSNNNIVTKPKNNVLTTYSAISDEKLDRAREQYKKTHEENKAYKKDAQMSLDPNNVILQSINSAKQFIMYAMFYGFYDDEDEYLENNYLNPNQGTTFSRHKLLIKHLKKSKKRDDGILLDVLRVIVAKGKVISLETFVKLISTCINFGLSPMRDEVYLVANDKMSYVHVHYMALIGYCEKIGLVTQKITLPEIKKDITNAYVEDITNDYVEVLLHPKVDHIHTSGKYIYKAIRKDISPFISQTSNKSSDFYFKKIAVVSALRACFAYKSEIKGVYIQEEQWIEDIDKKNANQDALNRAMNTDISS